MSAGPAPSWSVKKCPQELPALCSPRAPTNVRTQSALETTSQTTAVVCVGGRSSDHPRRSKLDGDHVVMPQTHPNERVVDIVRTKEYGAAQMLFLKIVQTVSCSNWLCSGRWWRGSRSGRPGSSPTLAAVSDQAPWRFTRPLTEASDVGPGGW